MRSRDFKLMNRSTNGPMTGWHWVFFGWKWIWRRGRDLDRLPSYESASEVCHSHQSPYKTTQSSARPCAA